jgi:hypothetical protein
MLDSKDLSTLSKIGNALWADSESSEKNAIETLAAVSLLNLNAERTLEKSVAALLERADCSRSSLSRKLGIEIFNQPFFRLSQEERLILVALHQGDWTYARLGRILKKHPLEVEELAWNARLSLSVTSVYPSGPASLGPLCPEYDAHRPWTQRFLDEEIPSARDRIFLQNHMLACNSCRQALNRCREVYFKVEEKISKVAGDLDPNRISSLERIFRRSPVQRSLMELTVFESLKIFLRRRDIQLGLLLLLGLVLFRFNTLS